MNIKLTNHYPNVDAVTVKIDEDHSIVIERDKHGKVVITHYDICRSVDTVTLGEE